MRRRSLLAVVTLLAALGAAAALPAAGAEEVEPPAAPLLALEKIVVEPADPSADTLCRLRVVVANRGTEIASQLGFAVTVNGVELGVYGNQLFMFPVPPGESAEVPLYNFWTSETNRPAPADGKLRVEVELREARWMKVQMEDDVEVWSPLGDVEGLPAAAETTLAMRGAGGGP